MCNVINNIGLLLNDLRNNNWHMTAFDFTYKEKNYDVLFEDNDNIEERRNPYASVLLTFIDIDDPERIYSVEANQVKMFFKPKQFRKYFGIAYSENLGNIFEQFFNYFLTFVPDAVPEQLCERQNNTIDHTLASRGGHNPNAIYCDDARRLGERDGEQLHRSTFIANLTQRRRPDLFQHFEREDTVTFYYSPNEDDELSTIEIINRFIARENSRRT